MTAQPDLLQSTGWRISPASGPRLLVKQERFSASAVSPDLVPQL